MRLWGLWQIKRLRACRREDPGIPSRADLVLFPVLSDVTDIRGHFRGSFVHPPGDLRVSKNHSESDVHFSKWVIRVLGLCWAGLGIGVTKD